MYKGLYNMENNSKINFIPLLTIFSLFLSGAHARSYPTDVVGRQLDSTGGGWAGHVGIVTADKVTDIGNYVVEALWQVPVLQINSLSNFKKASPFWGEKFGINKGDVSGTRIINEGAFQTSLKCAEYSMTLNWKAGSGQWGVPFTCPKFRCDTFVNYLYWWGGYTLPTYSPPGTMDNPSLPVYVFKAFPYYRAKINPDLPMDNSITSESPKLTINNASVAQLSLLTNEEFYKAVDLPEKELTTDGINNILSYSKNLNLSYEKRFFLLDKLSFVVSPTMLEQLISLYEQYSSDEKSVSSGARKYSNVISTK